MSVAESPTERPVHGYPHPPTPEPPDAATEAQFLASEADLARAKMGLALHELLHQAGVELSPRGWIRRHPWSSMAAAAGIGAGLGYSVTSQRSRSAENSERNAPSQANHVASEPRKSHPSRLAGLILAPLFASLGQAAKVALDRFLIGLIESAMDTESAAHDNAGATTEPEQEVPAAN